MADYDSSLPVETRAADHLQSNITQVGGAAIAVDNPLFAELTDGTTALTATTIGADHCLDVNLAGEGGAVISATNPVFAELTDGTNAIDAGNPLNVQVGDGTTQVAVTAGLTALKVDIVGEGGAAIAVDNPVFAELTDGTTALTATTIGADHCLDVNLAGEGGTAISATNPVFVEITDGTNAIGVDAGHPIYTSPAAPANTFIEYTTGIVNTGATDSTTFIKEAASGDIYVQRIIVSASGAFKAEVKYTETGADSTKAVGFATSANPMCIIELECYEACACAQANDGIHVHITNRDAGNMDCYCSIIGHT